MYLVLAGIINKGS